MVCTCMKECRCLTFQIDECDYCEERICSYCEMNKWERLKMVKKDVTPSPGTVTN